jgi:hypothetical protein
MSGFELQPTVLSDLRGRVSAAADDLGAVFGTVAPAPPDAGTTTAALTSVLDQIVLGVADVLGDLTDAADKLEATLGTYQTCENESAAIFKRLANPSWMTVDIGGQDSGGDGRCR